MIDKMIINKLSIELKEILEEELKARNEIVETSDVGFTNDSRKHIFVFFKISI